MTNSNKWHLEIFFVLLNTAFSEGLICYMSKDKTEQLLIRPLQTPVQPIKCLRDFFCWWGFVWVDGWVDDSFLGLFFFFCFLFFGVFCVVFGVFCWFFFLLLWVCTHWMDDFSAFFLILTIEYSCHPWRLQRGKWIQIKSIKFWFVLFPELQSVWSLFQLCPQILHSWCM